VVEKMTPAAIPHLSFPKFFLRSEKDGARENSAECILQPPVVKPIGLHAPLHQNLGCAPESHDRAHLSDCDRRQPEQYKAILAEWNAVVGVADDLQKESPVPPLMLQNVPNRASYRAKHTKSALSVIAESIGYVF
jgi:hypothetical protein